MLINVLDANSFRPLLISGAQSLIRDIDRINALNVFPVPDGDTGTNMSMTIQGGVEGIKGLEDDHIGKMFAQLAKSMTMSARGNSGVILSQFFKGMANCLSDKEVMEIHTLIEALNGGVMRAYKVVQNPTEGTMLTVMRVAAEKVKQKEKYFHSIDDVFDCYVKEAESALMKTPDLLPILKEAGVIDSGGAGFVCIFEGILSALKGEDSDSLKQADSLDESYSSHNNDESSYQEETLQEHLKYAVVAVSSGEGISNLFQEMGADVIVFGGQTMNPSSEDFIKAFRKIDAENIFVFPNNKNIILAAQQAADHYHKANVIIVPTKSIPSCYSALSMLDYTSDDLDEIMTNFTDAMDRVVSVSVTYSIRNMKIRDLDIHANDYIAIVDDDIKVCHSNKVEIVKELLKSMENIQEKEVIVFIYGKDVLDNEKQEIRDYILKEYPYLELGEIEGKQDIYSYFIAIE